MSGSLLSTLFLLLTGAAVARFSANRLNRWAVPAIVIELLLGFALGNTVLPFDRIKPLAGITELGVLTLFFQVGLEVRGGLLGSRPKAVLRLVMLSALTPLLAWWPLRLLFDLPAATTILCIAVVSATGTGVTLRALAQAGALQSPSGRLLVGVSVLDDLPAISLLTLSTVLGGNAPPMGGASPNTPPQLWTPLLVIALAWASFPLSRWWHRRHGPWRAEPLGVVLLLTGSSLLGEIAGLTSLLGALWGGVLLQRLTPQEETSPAGFDLRRQLAILSEVFLPLYFISVGMRLQLDSFREPSAWGMALVLFLLAVLSKMACALGVSQKDREAGIDRWLVVFGLMPRGLPGLVFASTALGAGVITPVQFSALVLMVSTTTVFGLLLLGRRLSVQARQP
ncbi:MAG: cation:proton antiporter [Prochlorococcaceae cyanobacterium]|jgi:Kef-type K+ transport system membrane component KefB